VGLVFCNQVKALNLATGFADALFELLAFCAFCVLRSLPDPEELPSLETSRKASRFCNSLDRGAVRGAVGLTHPLQLQQQLLLAAASHNSSSAGSNTSSFSFSSTSS
jgi:hypothetical protein